MKKKSSILLMLLFIVTLFSGCTKTTGLHDFPREDEIKKEMEKHCTYFDIRMVVAEPNSRDIFIETKDLKEEDTGLVIKKTMEYLFADKEVFEFVYAPENASYIFNISPNIMIYFNTNTEYRYSLSGGQDSNKTSDSTEEYEVDYDAYFHGYDQWRILIKSKESEEHKESLRIVFGENNIVEKETNKEFDLFNHINELNKMG